MLKISPVVGLVLLSLGLAGCVSKEQYQRALQEGDNLREQLAFFEQRNAALSAELERLKAELRGRSGYPTDDWQLKMAELREELARIGQLPAGVSTRIGPEGIVYDVEGAVLFASGKAELTQSGQTTLRGLADSLRADARRIRVEGHTDVDPIRNSPWKTNLRLSAERAVVVAEFLVSAGVPAERVGVGAYGPYRPKDPSNTDTAKAANRRVEILLIQERGADGGFDAPAAEDR